MCLYIYRLLIWLILPLALLRLLYKGIKQPAYLRHWNERLTLNRLAQADIWIHAVSLGESKLAILLANELLQLFQNSDLTPKFLFSCTTPTGRAEIARWVKNNQNSGLTYLPFDCHLLQQHALQQVQPKALVCMETELWPNLLSVCHKRGIPTFIANARLSKSSARKQRRMLKLFRPLLQNTHLLVQNTASRRRYACLAGEQMSGNIQQCGNSKFDLPHIHNKVFQQQLASKTTPDKGGVRLVFASTRRDETPALMDTVIELLTHHPQHRVIWVPRHPEQDTALLAKLLNKSSLAWGMFESGNANANASIRFLLINSFGHLTDVYYLADLVVLGGSFGAGGSHNLIEPGLMGKAIVAGPSRRNFAQAHKMLARAHAIIHLRKTEELLPELLRLIDDSGQRREIGKAAAKALSGHRGGTSCQADVIVNVLCGKAVAL